MGSYLGSVIEEKIALGTNMIIAVVNNKFIDDVINKLSYYKIININKTEKYTIIMLICKRKNTFDINKTINNIDKNSLIANQRSKVIFN